MDQYLDRTTSGPMFLRQDAIAELVVASLFKGADLGQYYLGAFVVMANHVHVLLWPLVNPSLLLKSIKGVTAREANRILGRTGEPFWQRESYDHCVRDGREWERVAGYIEENPVKAMLVGSAEEFAWSSANEKWRERVHTSVNAARRSACATKD
jgi:putative transposase